MPKIEERIASLKGRLKELEARQQQISARRKALNSRRQRAEDTRRKILVGTVVLGRMERGEFEEAKLRDWLAAEVKRAEDRELFGLPTEGGNGGLSERRSQS